VKRTAPLSLGFWRYLIGLMCLLPVVLLRPWRCIAARDLLPIGLLGVGQFAVLIVLLNYSPLHIPVARASLLFATFPPMTLLLSVVLGRERFMSGKVGGSLLAFAGVAVALGAAFCGAACSISYAPYVARYSSLHVTSVAMLAAVVALAALAIPEGLFAGWPAFTAAEGAAILFIGASSGVGFFCWVYALGNASPSLVTMFLALSPVTAALGGTFLLGEPLPLSALIGLA
jgi:drug/metabolite transporter (DMT)-like permease